MFSKEVVGLLLQVVTSWQVIAVTIAIVLYMSLVSYVSSAYRRPRAVSKNKPKKQKPEALAGPEEVTTTGANSNEELGLEEA
jgi:hypothetical protein